MQPIQPRPGRPVINGYGDGTVRVDGVAWAGPVLILPARALVWQNGEMFPDTPSLEAIAAYNADIEVLIIGSGARMRPLPPMAAAVLKTARIPYEIMGTGAACRTYNALLSDDRLVAAALLPV